MGYQVFLRIIRCIKLNGLNFRMWFKNGLKAQKLLAQGVWGKTCESSALTHICANYTYYHVFYDVCAQTDYINVQTFAQRNIAFLKRFLASYWIFS